MINKKNTLKRFKFQQLVRDDTRFRLIGTYKHLIKIKHTFIPI